MIKRNLVLAALSAAFCIPALSGAASGSADVPAVLQGEEPHYLTQGVPESEPGACHSYCDQALNSLLDGKWTDGVFPAGDSAGTVGRCFSVKGYGKCADGQREGYLPDAQESLRWFKAGARHAVRNKARAYQELAFAYWTAGAIPQATQALQLTLAVDREMGANSETVQLHEDMLQHLQAGYGVPYQGLVRVAGGAKVTYIYPDKAQVAPVPSRKAKAN